MRDIKILYACGKSNNSKLQLYRFLQATKHKPYIIKIAAYKNYSTNVNIDWTLDCLLNIYNPVQLFVDNDNFRMYIEQIKSFNPDLIISDLEYFTTYAGLNLNIPVWQCSSSIINFAFTKKQKYNLSLFKQYSWIFNKNPNTFQKITNIVENSSKKFVYSHLGDTDNPPELNTNYEYIRPYHTIGKQSAVCKHNIVAASFLANKNIINAIKNYQDNVMFSEFIDENYENIQLKNLYQDDEYFCNLANSNFFVCEGQATFLADSFYNNKKPFVLPNFQDPECLLNSTISEHFQLSDNLNNLNKKNSCEQISYSLNKDISFLHDKIDLFFN